LENLNYCYLCVLTLVLFSKYNYNDQVKEDEVGRTYRVNEREEEYIYDIGGKARKKETSRKTKT
jgi:hypothetical protein